MADIERGKVILDHSQHGCDRRRAHHGQPTLLREIEE
jgi:hypothetical protein